jgi:hypothetical protein
MPLNEDLNRREGDRFEERLAHIVRASRGRPKRAPLPAWANKPIGAEPDSAA